MRKKMKYRLRRILVVFIALALIVSCGYIVNKLFINRADNNNQADDNSEIGENIADNQNKDKIEAPPVNSSENSADKEKTVKEDVNITLSCVGDIMFHPREIKGAYDANSGTYDFKPYFEAVKEIIEASDIAVANFEGTTCGDDLYEYQGYPLFNAPDEVLDAIKYTGFDVLSTINNHTLDTRKTGVIRTIEKIKARGFGQVGTYIERPESRVLMQEVKGIKIAFLAYTEMLNGLESVMSTEDLDAMINVIDREKIQKDILDAKAKEADLIVMIVHWGDEYMTSPNARQENLKEFLLSEGVNIILGSHPHVIQACGGEVYNDKNVFVAYSTGNFISNQRTEEELPAQTEDGVIITLNIKKSGETGETTIEAVEYTPTWVYRVKENNKFSYKILPVMKYIESEEYSEDTKSRMQRSYNDTMAKLKSGFND